LQECGVSHIGEAGRRGTADRMDLRAIIENQIRSEPIVDLVSSPDVGAICVERGRRGAKRK
jgi:hypothetical protein